MRSEDRILPLTEELYRHPRVQAHPELKRIIEIVSDWDRFQTLSHAELAIYFGILSGVLMTVLHELDAADADHDD